MADEQDLGQLHDDLIDHLTSSDTLRASPYLPQGLPQGQTPEWHLNNPEQSPIRQFRGDESIKQYGKEAGDIWEKNMREAGASDDIISANRGYVEGLASGKARQHALSQLENLGHQAGWAHYLEEALPFAGSIRRTSREANYQYAEDAFGKGNANLSDYLTMGEKVGRMKQANDESWYEKMGHIAAGGLSFAGEIGMTGGLGAELGAAGAAKAGLGKVGQLGAAGLATTALRPTAAVEEYVRRGDKAPVMGEDGQPLVDAKGNFQFAEPDSEGARAYKAFLSQYIDNTIMPNLAGAFTKGTGSYAARVAKKTMAALAAGEASEELKYAASLAPESSDAHQLVFGGPKGRMEALKNLAIKTGGFGLMETGVQGFHTADEALTRRSFEKRIADVAKQDIGPGVDRSIAPTNQPVSPAEMLRRSAQDIADDTSNITRREANEQPLSERQKVPNVLGPEQERGAADRTVGTLEGIFEGMPEQAGETGARVPPERSVALERAIDESTGRVSGGEPGGGDGGSEGQPPLGQRVPGQEGVGDEGLPAGRAAAGAGGDRGDTGRGAGAGAEGADVTLPKGVRDLMLAGHTQAEAEYLEGERLKEEARRKGLKPPGATNKPAAGSVAAPAGGGGEVALPRQVKDVYDRNAKQIAKEGVPPEQLSEWLQKKGVKKYIADAVQAREMAKGQAGTDAQVETVAKAGHKTLAQIRDDVNAARAKTGLKPLTDEQVDDQLLKYMDAGQITRHKTSDGSYVYAHSGNFEQVKGEARRQASMTRPNEPDVTPQELRNDIEQLAARGRSDGEQASLRRAAEIHVQKGIQDGAAYADERARAPAQGDAGGTPAAAVPEAAGDKLRAEVAEYLSRPRGLGGVPPERLPEFLRSRGLPPELADAVAEELQRRTAEKYAVQPGSTGDKVQQALNDAFGESTPPRPGQGFFEAGTESNKVRAAVKEINGEPVVEVDFKAADKGSYMEAGLLNKAQPKAESVAFLRKLRTLVENLRDKGLPISVASDTKRMGAYENALEKAGYVKDEEGSTPTSSLWRPPERKPSVNELSGWASKVHDAWKALRLRFGKVKGDEGAYAIVREDGRKAGHMDLGMKLTRTENGGPGEAGAANRMFPGVTEPGDTVSRIHRIEIGSSIKGQGIGQALYLKAMAKHGADWYYNSQTYPPATNALKALEDKGLIEAHWSREPQWNQPGDIHLIRLTDKGKEAADRIGAAERKPSVAAIRSLDETPTPEAFNDRHDDVLGRRNEQGLGILADRIRENNLFNSQDELGKKFYTGYGGEAAHKEAKERGEVASAFADIWPDGRADLNYHTGNHIWDIAHEQGHVIAAAMGVERDPEFAAAYDKDMANGQITHYSSMAYHTARESDPVKARANALSEAAAEVDALLHDGGYTDDIEREIPNVAAYFKKRGMWPDEHVQRLPGTVKETREALNALRGHTEAAGEAAPVRDLAGARGGDQELPPGAVRAASTEAPGAEAGGAEPAESTGPAKSADNAIRQLSVSRDEASDEPRAVSAIRSLLSKDRSYTESDNARDYKGIASAFKGVFGASGGRGRPGEEIQGNFRGMNVEVEPRETRTENWRDAGKVVALLRFGEPEDLVSPLNAAQPKSETMAFVRKLDEFVSRLGDAGVRVGYFAEPNRAATYDRLLRRNGFVPDTDINTTDRSRADHFDADAVWVRPDKAKGTSDGLLNDAISGLYRKAAPAQEADNAIRRASVSKATQSAVDDLVASEPQDKPLDQIKGQIGRGLNTIRNGFLKFGGDSFPRTHQLSRPAGEAMTEASVARNHGQNLGQYHGDYVLGKDSTRGQEDTVGHVGMEMRLRYARQNIANEIEKAAQAGDEGRVEKLRKDLDDMHETTLGAEGLPLKSEQDFQNALNSPYVKQALAKFQGDTAKQLDKNYATYRGIEEKDIDTLTQIPGMPMNFLRATAKDAPQGDYANLNNLRQKGNPFSKKASLSGEYNPNFRDMLMNSFQRGEVAAKEAVMNRTLESEGLLIPANPGEAKAGFTNVENVRFRQPGDQVGKTAALIHNDVVEEYNRAKNVDTPAGWKKISKAINQIPLLGALSTSVEGLAHLKNQLIANFAPGMSVVDTWKNAVEAFKGSDAFKREMLELSNIGAAKPPGEHQGVLEQLPGIGRLLGAAKQATGFSLDPTAYMGDFIRRTDEVMRVSLAHAYDAAVPEEKQTQQGKTDFINHWQFNYNKKAMPQILALAKESGIGPFAVAATQGKLRNISMLFGGHGLQGLSRGEDAQLRALMLGRILTPIAAAAAVNYFSTGRMDGGEDAPPLSIYAGTDDQGKKRYLDVGTLTGVSPALRALGLMAQIEGARKGETAGDRIDKSTMDIVHGLADPVLGPGPRFAWTAVTGRDTYGKQVAGQAGYGESQAKKNLGAAILHTNPTAASLVEGGKSGGEQVAGALGPFGFKYNEGKAPAVGQFKEALKKTEDVYNEARLKARDQGLRVQEPPELKALNRFSAEINKYELAYHQKGITEEAKQRLRAAQAKIAQTALDYFQKVKASKP